MNPDYAALKVWAEMFYDAQKYRIGIANRVRSGEVFPEIFADTTTAAMINEHQIRLALRRQYRKTAPPTLIAWQKASTGIGDDLLARLLGHLGHPRIAVPYHWEGDGSERKLVADDPYERTVSQLWAYCGHGDPDRKPFKGMAAADAFRLGNPTLKMLVHLIAEGAIKQPGATTPDPVTPSSATSTEPSGRDPLDPGQWRNDTRPSPAGVDPPGMTTISGATPKAPPWPYRAVYDQRRNTNHNRTHTGPCVRCGPSGNPAGDGTPWSKAHQHADALRVVGKTILKDLWLASEC